MLAVKKFLGASNVCRVFMEAILFDAKDENKFSPMKTSFKLDALMMMEPKKAQWLRSKYCKLEGS